MHQEVGMNQELMDSWIATARTNPKRIAFPEATEEKILKAAKAAMDAGAIRAVLVGDTDEIRKAASEASVDISGMEIVDNTDEGARAESASLYLRYSTLLSESSVKRKGRDPMNYAFIQEAIGKVDAVFAGLSHTTGEVILAAQTFIGLKEGISTVSSMGIIDVPGFEGPYGSLMPFADAAVCVDPTPEELADIAISTCDTVKSLLGWIPRCALLSFSSDGSAEHGFVDRIRDAVGIANMKRPDLYIDGEFQLDSALLPATAAKKVRRPSEVAGKANVIVFPDINAGNIGVKIIQIFAKGDCYGPMLQGFRKPVSDCSRSAPVSELTGNIIMLSARA